MWLLGTARANLVSFSRPEDVKGGYAILSHTWLRPEEGEEDTFQKSSGTSSSKFRQFLILAEKDGYDYAWVDTCCIDKTSSTELTEAINSMFRYYALSTVCYVYLADVDDFSDDFSHDLASSRLRRCRWITRGWTLQELLASRALFFFSKTWTPFGSKFGLSGALKDATGIPAEVLRFETPFADMSIAARMSWASSRVTTRIEDRAYCLFGLFGINIPVLYGEGGNAFYRLLEEIMKISGDPSLFLLAVLKPVEQ
ncbi:heterokaryon incompatibility protein-domain-containing protein [Epithele typhae]|uniref:heterokaryon incompatibility protein-domain-containing protein n=1 Tax=Epithele typhae TaxID=378194 RepID=UPI00200735C8|nr:heterokaryon incompatibility protein-domain-containing protein [Epithele typhae]KAH9940772.1 heterokaryon incompatibility protein-domain-containing protein [Epithele typhae]